MSLPLQTSLLLGAVLAYVAAGLYAYVGTRMLNRNSVDPAAGLALRLFVVWWLSIAASEVLTGTATLFAALQVGGLPIQITISHLYVLFIALALWGLMYYLLYLFTGKRVLLAPVTVYYILAYAFLVYYITASTPVGVDVRRWQATLLFEEPLTGPLFRAVLLVIVVPPILGAIGYFTLLFRLREPALRWRAGLVSSGILVWFGVTFLSASAGFPVPNPWYLPSRIAGLAGAFMVLMAYHPPARMARRFGMARTRPRGNW